MQHQGFADLSAPSGFCPSKSLRHRAPSPLANGSIHLYASRQVPLSSRSRAHLKPTRRQTSTTPLSPRRLGLSPPQHALRLVLSWGDIESKPYFRDGPQHFRIVATTTSTTYLHAAPPTVNNYLPTRYPMCNAQAPHTPVFRHLFQPSRDPICTQDGKAKPCGGGTVRLDLHSMLLPTWEVRPSISRLQFQRGAGFAQKFDIDIFGGIQMSPTQGRFLPPLLPPASLQDLLGQRLASQIRFSMFRPSSSFCFFFCLPPRGSSVPGTRMSEQKSCNAPRETVLL